MSFEEADTFFILLFLFGALSMCLWATVRLNRQTDNSQGEEGEEEEEPRGDPWIEHWLEVFEEGERLKREEEQAEQIRFESWVREVVREELDRWEPRKK